MKVNIILEAEIFVRYFNPWGHKFSLGNCLCFDFGQIKWCPPVLQATEDNLTNVFLASIINA
tara:strand:- start:275 stop:460 length:186 start_codon:yes stop_codon:yes gene_type:complete